MNARRRTRTSVIALTLLATALSACGDTDAGDQTGVSGVAASGFDAERAYADAERMVALGPRPSGSAANAEQAELLAGELRDAGVDHVTVGAPPLRNVTGVIAGERPGYVVVGAHHDTKDIPEFVGANDGASGAAVVLELARSLPAPLPGPSIAIALFDGEEARGNREFRDDGTRGSNLYVETAAAGGDEAAGIPPLGEIKAMVLFDMVGDCDLQIPLEQTSDKALYDTFSGAAGGAPFKGTTYPIGDDHSPFQKAGIPAVDLIDFSFGGEDTPGVYWHTPEDTLDKICPESLDAVGEAAVKAIPALP